MTEVMPLSKARNKLLEVAERSGKERRAIEVTKRGEPVLAILPWEVYESLMETLEIASDQELMGQLRKGLRELEEGNTLPIEKVAEELGYEL
jgi:prevent-host-death family protein